MKPWEGCPFAIGRGDTMGPRSRSSALQECGMIPARRGLLRQTIPPRTLYGARRLGVRADAIWSTPARVWCTFANSALFLARTRYGAAIAVYREARLPGFRARTLYGARRLGVRADAIWSTPARVWCTSPRAQGNQSHRTVRAHAIWSTPARVSCPRDMEHAG